jgi:anti-sigma factor RsiW
MSEHVNGWLAAYFDGELGNRRLQKVRAHLEECISCQEELATLTSLRQLLGEIPEAGGLLPAKQFASQVALQLSRCPSQPLWRRTVTVLWSSVPAMLLAAWVFAQALFLVMTLSGIALNLGLWGPSELAITYQFSPVNALIVNLGISALLGLMILSWLASWWISQQANVAHQATE